MFFVFEIIGFLLRNTKFSNENNMNINKLTMTTLAPAGVAYTYDITIPLKKQVTDNTAEHITTER